MQPAEERLDAADAARDEVGLRLVVDEQVASRERLLELACELGAGDVAGIVAGLVQLDAVAAVLLGDGERGRGPAEDGLVVGPVLAEDRTADARADGDADAVHDERLRDGVACSGGHDPDLPRVVGVEERAELVVSEPRDELAAGELPAQAERRLDQQRVPAVRAEHLDDLGEAVEVEHEHRARLTCRQLALDGAPERPAVVHVRQVVVRRGVLELGDL